MTVKDNLQLTLRLLIIGLLGVVLTCGSLFGQGAMRKPMKRKPVESLKDTRGKGSPLHPTGVLTTVTIGGKIYEGRSGGVGVGPVFAPDPRTPAITTAQVMVQNQHSGGAVITYATMGASNIPPLPPNEWRADIPVDGDYVIMFSAPGYDVTSREVTVDASGVVRHPRQYEDAGEIKFEYSTDPLKIDAYLPPLFKDPLTGDPSPDELPLANLLVFAFYDFMVNGEPDGYNEDMPLNGVTFYVHSEEGVLLATGVTGTQPASEMPGGQDPTGLYYFKGLPPGEVIVTSDASTVTNTANPHIGDPNDPTPDPAWELWFKYPDKATRDLLPRKGWYLDYTEEGGPAWDPKLRPGDPGTEDGGFLIWHGYVEEMGPDAGCSDDPGCSDPGTISGTLIDADGGFEADEPEDALVAPLHPGTFANEIVPDGLIILFTDDETIKTQPVATVEAGTGPTDPRGAPWTTEGYYEFTDIPPGRYKMMMFDIPLDYVWVQKQLNVPPGTDVTGITMPWVPRFGARGQGYVYDTSTGLGIPGLEVHIRYKSGAIKMTETTDGSGWYNFDFLPEVEVLGHVDVELPVDYHGAIKTATFYPDATYDELSGLDPSLPVFDPDASYTPPGPWGGVTLGPPFSVDHNAMNRYIQWFTANYRADLYLEPIPAGTADIRGVVYYDHLERTLGGGWEGDGTYDPEEERTIHGVTVELYNVTDGVTEETVTTGKVDKAALADQGWHQPYTWPPDEWGGVFVGPMPGFYEFRGLDPTKTYRVTIFPSVVGKGLEGYSASPLGTDVVTGVTLTDGEATTINFGVNTRPDPSLLFGVPLAGEIEGGVFDDLFVDMRIGPPPAPTSLMAWEKAAINGVVVGVYDHLGYKLGEGIQGNPVCFELDPGPPPIYNPLCPPGEDQTQKPELERRFAPGVHVYVGNDPSAPRTEDENGNGEIDFKDYGTDGLPSHLEPGYDPITNPDPNGDDYDPITNPSGTEGNGDWDYGEWTEDGGVDGLLPWQPTYPGPDEGELDGKLAPGYNNLFMPLILPYTFGQGKFKFEADWSLIPMTGLPMSSSVVIVPYEQPLVPGFPPLPAPALAPRISISARNGKALSDRAMAAASSAAVSVTPGDVLTITGVNFGDLQGYSTVSLDGQELKAISWSDTEIEVQIGRKALSGSIVVATATGGPSNALAIDIADDAWRTEFKAQRFVYVDASNTGPEDGSEAHPYNTINEALDNLPSVAPRYVVVAPGYYKERLHIKEDDIRLIGAGPMETTIDGIPDALSLFAQGFDNGGGPVIFIGAGGMTGSVENIFITGFTITGGSIHDDIGCGIFGDYGNRNIDINNCIIHHNGGYYGGGIWFHKTNHDVRIWSNNIAYNGNNGGYGGGISVNDEPFYPQYGTIFEEHDHGQPEHIWDDYLPGPPPGTYEIYNNLIHHNWSPDYGAGISLYEIKDHLKLWGNMLIENHGEDHGAGMFFEDSGPIDIWGNVFLRNMNYDDGGAISFEDVGDTLSHINVWNNVFAENIADDHAENHARGAALAFDDVRDANVFNNTIVGNIVCGSYNPAGGGIDSERHGHEYNGQDGPLMPPGYSDPKIFNNIIVDNWKMQYDQPAHGDEEDLPWPFGRNFVWTPDELHVDNPAMQETWETYLNSESFSHVKYNIIGDGSYVPGDGNIHVADPNDIFEDYANHDYRLKAGSPAINVGDGPAGPSIDIAGFMRDASDGKVDAGAYEYGSPGVRIPISILGAIGLPIVGSTGP